MKIQELPDSPAVVTPRSLSGGLNGRRRPPVFGAVDLGTNNCRLLVARPVAGGFRVVDAFSRIVRLGEGLSSSGRLSDAAVDRTIEALKICANRMRERGVTQMRNVATQACRQASNCKDFVERVEHETGLRLDIISPAEEARLAAMGCQALMDRNARRAIVFDIGGGSTELIWVAINRQGPPRILGWTSVPYGVVNLWEMFGSSDALSRDRYQTMRELVAERLAQFDRRYNLSAAVQKGGVQMLGTSGTVTTLTSLYLQLPRYDRSKVDGADVGREDLRDLCSRLSVMDFNRRAGLSCIGADRAELIVAGCAILDAILAIWPVSHVRVADRGIREGMLMELMNGPGRIEPRRGGRGNRARDRRD
ncbi:MAG TPA: Ppx/GppA phosphatase family protein [Sphingomonadales bacterium]